MASYISTKFVKIVTVSLDRTDFNKPIPAGTLAELIGTVVKVGNTSVQVKVEIYIEQMHSEHVALAGSWC